MNNPKTKNGEVYKTVNQDFGPSASNPVNMDQIYGREAMMNMTYGPGTAANQDANVGQASINQVYGGNPSVNEAYGQPPPYYEEKMAGATGAPPPMPPPAVQRSGGTTFISLPEIIVNQESDDIFKTNDFSDTSIRRGFICKVYSLVLMQLAITTALVATIDLHYPTKLFMQENLGIVLPVAVITYLVTFICIQCCEGPRRRVPYNYIFLLMFTVALSMMLGMATANVDDRVVLISFGITMLIVVSLTVYAFQTKYDFTLCGGFLVSLFLCVIIVGFLAFFNYSEPMYLLYCALGIIFFSFLLVYDTQLIIGGNHKYTISPEEYVFGALCIYLDIINIFIRILRIMR